jgi:hypothetical protein
MANIKKNFNFRNGVQVDDDNLLVTSTGLVGIGTTVPTEALDVRGNVKIIGDLSATNSVVGILTITELKPTQIIGAGVSIKSGIVTAEGAGIVTFYGDARFLQGMPTSQWQDVDVGLGYTSIFNTGGNVGVGTTDPRATVQIGGDVDSSQEGVGISSVGNIKATGIVTASSFVGNLTGNITGATTISGNVDLNADLDVDGHTELDNVSIAGVATVTGNIIASGAVDAAGMSIAASVPALNFNDTNNNPDFRLLVNNNSFIIEDTTNTQNRFVIGSTGNVSITNDLDIDGHTNLDNLSISGFTTITQDLNVDGHTNLDNVSVAGVTTFAGIIEGVAGQNKIPFLYSNMTDLPSAGSYHGAVAHVHATGSLYYAHAGQWWELVNKESDGRVGTGTETYNIGNLNSAGIITATTELNSPLIGVGTDVPANPIQVRGTGNTEIQVTSDTGIAGLTVGREPSTANTNNAELRYGGGAGAPYSTAQSLDLLNYGTGNFNYYIGANNPNAVAGDFHWHKGVNSARLMTLTNTGRLGIGITNPGEKLTVAGVCTVTSNSFVGGNLNVSGNSTIGGNVTVSGSLIIPSINTNIIGNVTGDLSGNVFNTSGISTFRKIGINTTEALPSVDLDCLRANATFKMVGIGSTNPDGILDVSGGLSQASKKFILLPKVSAAGTSVLQSDSAEGGALIYNTTLRKLQFYNGDAWETVTSQI